MYNLVKMELYRLFKATLTWVVIGLSVLYLLFAVTMTNMELEFIREQGEAFHTVTEPGLVVEEDTVTMNVGIYFDTNMDWVYNDINVADFFIVLLQSGSLLLVGTFFTAIFMNRENKNGFIKNIAGRVRYKGVLFLSKLPAVLIFNVLLMIIFYILSALFIRIIMGNITLDVSLTQIKLIAIQLLLHFAFSVVVAMFTTVSRSTAFSSTLGAVFCMGIGSLIWTAINAIVKSLDISDDFFVNKYTIVYNIQQVGRNFDFDNTARVLIVAAAFIVVSGVLSVITMNRRDVR